METFDTDKFRSELDLGFEGQWNENVRLWYNLLIIIQYTKVPFQGPFRML